MDEHQQCFSLCLFRNHEHNGSFGKQFQAVFDFSENWRNSLRQRLCLVCLSGRRIGFYRTFKQTTTHRRHSRGTIYARTGFFVGDFYRLSNQRLVGSHHFDNRYFLAILCVRGLAESLGQENAKLQIVFLLFGCRQRGIGCHHHFGLLFNGQGNHNRLEDNSHRRLQHFTFVWLQKNQQCLCRFGRFRDGILADIDTLTKKT